jgi:predicted nucleic acid-binding protein
VTRGERGVLDASVAVKCLLIEDGSDAARAAVAARPEWIAPDLIHLEVASVALKSVRRGLIDRPAGTAMVAKVGLLLLTAAPCSALKDEAFRLGAEHGFSAYDAAYLALAQAEGLAVLTADIKLIERARNCGLSHLVEGLERA